MSETFRYQWAGIPVEDYARDLDDLWAEMQTPNSALSREAQERGIDVGPLRQIGRKEAIDVQTEGQGFDPVTVAIVVALAPVATATIKALTPIIHDVWKYILLPRILQRRGDKALVPKK
jgi:hypothetical protein